jgi:D-alanyl-D-alanine carboxypeptidase
VTDPRRRDVHRRKRRSGGLVTAIITVVVVALVAAIVVLWPRPTQEVAVKTPSSSPSAPASASPSPTSTPTPTFDKTAQSIDDPASAWVVVNKLRPLNPQDYAAADLVETPVPKQNPSILRQAVADAVVAMFAQYKAETGLEMQVQSAYRSYSTQVRVYNGWVSSKGQAYADSHSARAGHSEHQTGLALDISALPLKCPLEACFADTPQGQWLAANAYKFGFILRYPNGMDAITGYTFEPWHYRYVGVELATEMHDEGVATLEEFFDLPPAPTYAG